MEYPFLNVIDAIADRTLSCVADDESLAVAMRRGFLLGLIKSEVRVV